MEPDNGPTYGAAVESMDSRYFTMEKGWVWLLCISAQSPAKCLDKHLAMEDWLWDCDRMVQEPRHRVTSGYAIRSADTGLITKGMDRYDYSWVPKWMGFIANLSQVGLKTSLQRNKSAFGLQRGPFWEACHLGTGFFEAALFVLGLSWSFAPSCLDSKAPTNALLSLYFYEIIVYVGEQKLRTSYSAILLTSLPMKWFFMCS